MSNTPDLLDLLRLACGQGKMRLHVWFGSERGHQANLANAGDGWTVEHDRDPLVAIEKVLRIRFGKMLERKRAGEDTEGSIHQAHRDDSRHQFTEASEVDGSAVDDGIRYVLSRRGFVDDKTIDGIIDEVLDRIWGKDPQPNLHSITMTTAAVDEFEALL
jgi:hypothetical protein